MAEKTREERIKVLQDQARQMDVGAAAAEQRLPEAQRVGRQIAEGPVGEAFGLGLRAKAAFDQWRGESREAPTKPYKGTVLDAFSDAAGNLAASGEQVVKDTINPLLDIEGTAKGLYALASGLVQKLIPGEQEDEKVVNAVADMLKERYGGWMEVKRTLANDPVGMLSDLSAVVNPLGASRAAGKVGLKGTARLMEGASDILDPVTLTAKSVSKGADLLGEIGAAFVGTQTGLGADIMKEAFDAGSSGIAGFTTKSSPPFVGRTQQAGSFKRGLDNPLAATADILDAVDVGLKNLKADRDAKYVERMKTGADALAKDPTQLSMAPIYQAIMKVQKEMSDVSGTELVNTKLTPLLGEIKKTVADWGQSAQQYPERLTPMGMDQLKQRIGGLVSDNKFVSDPQQAKLVTAAYQAIWQEIAKQAPQYAEIMKDYAAASQEMFNLRKELSINPQNAPETALRKIMAAMRNNVNTNFGKRKESVQRLADASGEDILASIAGAQASTFEPRGLSRLNQLGGMATGAGVAGLGFGGGSIDPVFALGGALAGLATTSPRIMAGVSYKLGQINSMLPAAKRVKWVQENAGRPLGALERLDAFEQEEEQPQQRRNGGRLSRIKARLGALRV